MAGCRPKTTGGSNDGFLRATVGVDSEIEYRSVTCLLVNPRDLPHDPDPDRDPEDTAGEPTWSLLIRALHLAFAAHLPLSLSPDVLWYAIVHEIAVHVRLNAAHYATLFTATTDRKQTITIHDDSLLSSNRDWGRSIRLVHDPIRAQVGADLVDLLQPAFSTTGVEDWTASLVALMDVISPYYELQWISLCGIPKIRLEGTPEDWSELAERARELSERFELLGPWFADLLPVLRNVAATAAGAVVDEEFWGSLYKWRSQSGGARITGWITAFFAHQQTESGLRPRTSFDWQGRHGSEAWFHDNSFPSHLSVVPFRWQTPDAEHKMAFLGGAMGLERDGDFIRPVLGAAVARLAQ